MEAVVQGKCGKIRICACLKLRDVERRISEIVGLFIKKSDDSFIQIRNKEIRISKRESLWVSTITGFASLLKAFPNSYFNMILMKCSKRFFILQQKNLTKQVLWGRKLGDSTPVMFEQRF